MGLNTNEVTFVTNPVTGGGTNLTAGGAVVPVPYILAQSAVPVILAPNGTVNAAGVLTLNTALPTTYSGGAWVRLPAGAVVGGLAGLYWAVFSSTTAGALKTLFASPETAFIPYVPTVALVAAVGSESAYTQTTAEVTLINSTIPASALGASGSFRTRCTYNGVGGGGNKTPRGKLGGSTVINPNNVATAGSGFSHTVYARGVNRQYAANGSSGDAGSAGAQVYLALDSAADMAYVLTAQLTAATDGFVIEAFAQEVFPS